MAVSLSNNFSLCCTPSPCVSLIHSASTKTKPCNKPPKKQLHKTLVALKPPHLYRPHLVLSEPCRILGFNLSTLSPFNSNNCRPSFTSSLTLHDANVQTNDDEGQPNDLKISGSKADPRGTLSLKSLINVYKEALLDGDEKAASEVEAMICVVENEKYELVQKLSVKSAEIKSQNQKYIRLQADFDNFRKRTEKQRLTIRSDAQGDVIESLLPMVDSFERAKQQIKPETEKEKKIDTSYQGIYKQFVEILRSLRVAVVPTIGKRFDPSMRVSGRALSVVTYRRAQYPAGYASELLRILDSSYHASNLGFMDLHSGNSSVVHEAIAREESQEFKEGIVSQELRRGFLLGDQLVRPAMVKVSNGPRKEKPTSATGNSTGQPTAAAGLDNR